MGFQAFLSPSLFLLALMVLNCFHMGVLGAEASNKLYIVYMGERKHEHPRQATVLHHDMLTSLFGSKEEALSSIIYSYRHGFSGFAACMTDKQARHISDFPGVVSVRPSRKHQLHTTRSWDYLQLDYNQPAGLLHESNYGEDIIIGIIDSGIWPESSSFNDEGYSPIPARWKGKCQLGDSFGANNCSKKIIGARWYIGGTDAEILRQEYQSPRCMNYHGAHTASTAAGVVLKNISYHGLGAGTARGGAPNARIAVYKACWGSEGICDDSAVLKAMDDAIHDGVDLLSVSLEGGDYGPGSLHAVAKGIPVIFSAGNDGPAPQSVVNDLPWVITVAASTIDRSFPTAITLGNSQRLVGQSIYYELKKDNSFKELFDGGSCTGTASSLNGSDINGKVVLCYLSSNVATSLPREDLPNALTNVIQAGGGGVIFAQYTTSILENLGPCNGIPCVLVDFEIANQILSYLYATTVSKPVVKVSPTRNAVGKEVVSARIAAFSSRGPSATFPGVLKPDISAPGVSILAAGISNSYVFDSGTSMACPHVSGIVALLKSVHPHWSPAAIKSAIVTTASVTDEYGLPIEAEGVPRKLADPFDYGGGQINPNKANDPGLVYDIDPSDYFKFFNCTFDPSSPCDARQIPLYYLNLPSISIPNLKRAVTVWRTLTNVGEVDATYKAIFQAPGGIAMVVEPSVLVFNATHRVHTFKITFTPLRKVQGGYTFGSLSWYGGRHKVRIPIAVRTVIQDFYADTS